MINIENLKKSYNQFQLFIHKLKIEKGDRVALIGNNGAGKTTMLRLIVDIIERTSGTLTIDNQDVSSTTQWKKILGSYLDEGYLIDFLKPQEYINFIYNYSNPKSQIPLEKEEILNNFFPYNSENKLIRELSKGNQLKVGIISALISNPQILILDEPFSNLDPTSRFQLIELINNSNEIDITLISSHDINEVIQVSNKYILIRDGEIIKNGSISENTSDKLKNLFKV